MGGPEPQQPAEIQREAQRLSRSLFASHRELRAILERHEATIQKRWIKKTKTQRLAILRASWANMATMHRPDLNTFIKEYRDSFIWPYINQEDLSKPKTLPLLLNARGRHDPCDFAAADGEAMGLGIVLRVIRFDCAVQHVMVLNGAYGPDEYGKLFAFHDHPDAKGWLMDRKQFVPRKGLTILEAQERLLGFLVSCCKQILHEIPEQVLISDAFPIKPPPQLKTEADTGGFHSLAIMAAEAPYRVPEHLDFERIESILAAQASASEDHMWSLREDPGYFADTQRELKEHRPEMIKDTNGRPHPVLDKSRNHKPRGYVLCNLLAEAFIPLEIFSNLQRQAQDLRALQQRYASIISPLGTLPKEYLQAILKFRHYLRQVVKEFGAQLMCRSTASPPLRRLFVRDPPVHASSSGVFVVKNSDIKMNSIEKKLILFLSTMWEKDEDLLFISLPVVVDELQRLLDSEPKAKELLSPYIASILGKISIISQCLTQLELYQPWASGFELATTKYKYDIEEDFAKRMSTRCDIFEAIQEKNLGRAVILGDLSGGRFAYPIDKRRTRENTETLRQSEENLDTFWAKIDELVHSKAGDLTGTAVQRLLSQSRIIQRTPEWVEPIKRPKKAEIVSTTDQDVEALYKPLSTLYFGLTPSKPDVPDGTLAKTKTKTRGTTKGAPTAATLSQDPLEHPKPYGPQPTIPVNARALKVFRTLFFNPSPTATPGEVPWSDFLYALTSTGFEAEKLYGSVWQFRPTLLDVDRSTQFHEPHPHGKIPFHVARRHGRRLNRAYGWFGGMFTLKEK
ncbi:hypothetical protein F5883DRAFT_627450 [Diaporthe sp. PMI_573]|nr:hypothetical protein F5883DRAFT_627450 [Diaporthaceae sp. PMI_573]